ncbi:MAG: hypothetical protein J1E05_03075 [Eubacterium sp.]|nr:hypothetical protein [Eubacterium sp.]
MKRIRITKRLLGIVLAILILFSAFSVIACETVKAEDNEYEIMPCFTTIMSETYDIQINGLKATLTASLIPKYTTTLQITLELQKYTSGSWKTDKTWIATAYDDYLITDGSKLINVFADYRLKVTFKADQETSVRYRYPSD